MSSVTMPEVFTNGSQPVALGLKILAICHFYAYCVLGLKETFVLFEIRRKNNKMKLLGCFNPISYLGKQWLQMNVPLKYI